MPSKAIIPQTSLILYQPTPTRSSFFPFKKSTRKSRTRSFDRHGMPHMAIITVVVTCKTHASFAGNFAIAVSIGDTLLRRYRRPFPSPSLPSTLLLPPSLSASLSLSLIFSNHLHRWYAAVWQLRIQAGGIILRLRDASAFRNSKADSISMGGQS